MGQHLAEFSAEASLSRGTFEKLVDLLTDVVARVEDWNLLILFAFQVDVREVCCGWRLLSALRRS